MALDLPGPAWGCYQSLVDGSHGWADGFDEQFFGADEQI
jgi:hypothetical protein